MMMRLGLYALLLLAVTQAGAAPQRPRYGMVLVFDAPRELAVTGVPEAVRAVPLHPDDGYLAGHPFAIAPIVDDAPGDLTFNRSGLAMFAEYWWLEAGGTLTYAVVSGERVQQNQFGEPEGGPGTSLRFYEFDTDRPVSLVAYAGVRVPLTPRRDAVALAAGREFDPLGTSLFVRSGWNRFAADEVWKETKVARIRVEGYYARLDVRVEESAFVSLKALRRREDITAEPQFEGLALEGAEVVWSLGFRLLF
jgi:hypothetical protein